MAKELTKNKKTEFVVDPKDSAEIIHLFETLNPAAKRWYCMKGQRTVIDRLIIQHGYDQLVKVMKFLPKVAGRMYYPTITTPLELENKWAALVIAVKRERAAMQESSDKAPNVLRIRTPAVLKEKRG